MIGETIRPTRDEQLIMNISRGDRDALAEVYLQHKGAVYAFALSILRQAHWNHPRGHVWNVFVRPASS